MSKRAHPSAETIAEYTAGVPGGGFVFLRAFRRQRLAVHLARCPQCSSLAHQVRQVSVLLARTPQPPMPASVAERLTAALAAESDVRIASPGVQAPEPVLTAADGHPDGSDRQAGDRQAGDRQAGDRQAGGQGRAADGRRAGGRARRALPRPSLPLRTLPRRALVPVAMGTLLVLGGGGYLLSQSGASPARSYSAQATGPVSSSNPSPQEGLRIGPDNVGVGGSTMSTGYRIVRSGTDYQPATLRAQVSHELAVSAGAATVLAPAGLAGCVRRVAGEDHVVFVDLARYRGASAFVIASTGRAWVAGVACSATRPDLIASVTLGA